MQTIKNEVIVNQIINKSTFITYLTPMDSIENAKKYLNIVKEKHPDATHHVFVYTIGSTGEYGHCSDNGEPSGSAGQPILEVFRKNDITNYACVVVRYFGGVKLGMGGLIRAYSSSAALALKEALIIPIIKYGKIEITINYNQINILEKKIEKYEIISKNFLTKATYLLQVPQNDIPSLIEDIKNLTNNQAIIKIA